MVLGWLKLNFNIHVYTQPCLSELIPYELPTTQRLWIQVHMVNEVWREHLPLSRATVPIRSMSSAWTNFRFLGLRRSFLRIPCCRLANYPLSHGCRRRPPSLISAQYLLPELVLRSVVETCEKWSPSASVVAIVAQTIMVGVCESGSPTCPPGHFYWGE